MKYLLATTILVLAPITAQVGSAQLVQYPFCQTLEQCQSYFEQQAIQFQTLDVPQYYKRHADNIQGNAQICFMKQDLPCAQLAYEAWIGNKKEALNHRLPPTPPPPLGVQAPAEMPSSSAQELFNAVDSHVKKYAAGTREDAQFGMSAYQTALLCTDRPQTAVPCLERVLGLIGAYEKRR